MAQLLTLPLARVQDANGVVYSGAKLHAYLTGTTTPTPTYTDATLTTTHANPVPADAGGFLPPIYLNPTVTYRFLAKTSAGANIDGMDFDPVSVTAAGDISFVQAGTGATSSTVQAEIRNLPVTPDQFGAAGDGAEDDTAAVQAALNTGRSVNLTQGKTYLVKSALTWSASNVSMTGGGVLKMDSTFVRDTIGGGLNTRMMFVSGNNVTFNGVNFDATGAPLGSSVENGFIWGTGFSLAVANCQFIGNPKGTCIYSMSTSPYLRVTGCAFIDNSGAVFAKGANPVIANNVMINCTDAAIAINGMFCVGAVVANNTINNELLHEIPSMIAMEEGPSEWIVTGNTLIGVNGGGIIGTEVLDGTPVRGGIISNNVITGRGSNGELPTRANPASLVSFTVQYADITFTGNQVRDCPLGNANSRLVILPVTGGLVADNIIDGTASTSISSMIDFTTVEIGGNTANVQGLTVRDNKSYCATGGRHIAFGPGDYDNEPVQFIGGEFQGGSIGIDAQVNTAGMQNFKLYIRDITSASMVNVVSAAAAIGDRATFLNAGAWAFPHRIGVFTEMRGTGAIATPGAQATFSGDKIWELAPTAGGREGVVKVGAVWKDFGSVAA